MDADVVVIGAGVAGLAAAVALTRAGRRVEVVDAADAVGGRVRTDRVDGFRVDRGFQLVNPAYPQARRQLDLRALDLQHFGRGVTVRGSAGLRTLAAPTRHPALLQATLRSGLVEPGTLLALVRLLGGSDPDVPRAVAEDRAGLTGEARTLVDRFLAGVLAEDDGSTSARFTGDLLRYFAVGRPAVPALGMGAIPRQLEARLADPVRLGTRVNSVRREGAGWVVDAVGGDLRADAVVVATDAVAAASLLNRRWPAMRGLATWWFAPEQAPDTGEFLVVDGRPGQHGPVVNTAVVSAVAPRYAPPGRHLVQASTLMPDGQAPAEADVRRHVGELYGVDATAWPVVARHEIARALPVVAAAREAVQPLLEPGLAVAGDHVGGASLQGALRSGRRAAAALLGRTLAN